MIASLAMYDLPWLRAANDALWAGIARRLVEGGIADVPGALARGGELDDIWRSSELLFAQTCGYPLAADLRESVRLVRTPRYRAEGCTGSAHRAAIVVRADDPAHAIAGLAGRRAAVNSHASNTGMNLFRAAIAPLAAGRPFFSDVLVTGSHARSLAAILSGRADVASIDPVTLAHLGAHYPRHARRWRVLDWTSASPNLPLITAGGTSDRTADILGRALDGALADPACRPALDALRIEGFDTLPLESYAVLLEREHQARALGYPILH